MKPTSIVFKAVRVKTPVKAPAPYEFPALSSISSDELVNSNFGKNSYWIHIQPQHIVVNRTAGYANIKGDVVQEVMKVLDENHNV